MTAQSVKPIQYAICLGAFLSNLSAGMFNIALVDIAGDFGRSVSATQWVVTIYLLAISVCLPLMGALGDSRGRRRVHNAGLLLFLAGCLGCALAGSLPLLVGFRILQGVGASMYQANNMALIVALFPPERRGRALGTVSTFVAAGALIGPSLGGVLIQWFSWRASFAVLAAAALGTWLLAQRFIPADRPAAAGASRLDGLGAALFAAALTGLVTGLNLGAALGWDSAAVWLLFGSFAVLAALFAARSRSARPGAAGRQPFIRPDLFRHPLVVFGVLLTVVTYAAAFATQLVLPAFLRSVMGIQPAAAGLIAMAYPASLIVAAPLSGGGSDRFGSAPLIVLGMSSMAAALGALCFLSADTSIVYVAAFLVLLGCSMGMITSPNNNIVMSRTPKANLGMMSSMIALTRNLGMMLGAAVGGLLLSAAPAAGTGAGAGEAAARLVRSFHGGYAALAGAVLAALLVFLWIVRRDGRTVEAQAARARRERSSAV